MSSRNLRTVTVNYLTGGAYQIGLLIPAGDLPTKGTAYALPYGPVALDVNTRKLVAYQRFEIPSERLREAPTGTLNENLCQHDWVEGLLYPYWGTTISDYSLDVQMPFEGLAHYVGSLVSTPDGYGDPTDSLQSYGIGSSTPGTVYPALHIGKLKLMYYQAGGYLAQKTVITGRNNITRYPHYDYEGQPDGGAEYNYDIHVSGMDIPPTGYVSIPGRVKIGEDFEVEIPYDYKFVPFTPVFASTPVDETTIDALAHAIADQLTTDLNHISRSEPQDGYFYAVQEAVEAFQTLNTNGISWLKELLAIKELIMPIVQLVKKPWSPKSWANVALCWHYGIRLTIQDDKALFGALKRLKHVAKSLKAYKKSKLCLQTRYGTFSEPSEETDRFQEGFSVVHARVVATPVYPPEYNSLDILVEDLGFKLNAQNAWDLIPFSFVVDWFTGIGDLLEQVDYAATIIGRLNCKHIVSSVKNMTRCQRDAYMKPFGLTGALRFCTYKRRIAYVFPNPPLRVGAPTFLRYWWEGGLLILGIKGK